MENNSVPKAVYFYAPQGGHSVGTPNNLCSDFKFSVKDLWVITVWICIPKASDSDQVSGYLFQDGREEKVMCVGNK